MATDEQIALALLSNTSKKAAADSLGINVTTIYERLKKPEFKDLYKEQQHAVISEATRVIQGTAVKAVETIAEIMNNEDNAPQVRLNAADMILRNCMKYTSSSDELERKDSFNKMFGDFTF